VSASEKLKHPDFDHRDDFDVVSWAALVAVVAGAERASRNGARMPVSDPPLLPDEMDDLRAALAALEEALGESVT